MSCHVLSSCLLYSFIQNNRPNIAGGGRWQRKKDGCLVKLWNLLQTIGEFSKETEQVHQRADYQCLLILRVLYCWLTASCLNTGCWKVTMQKNNCSPNLCAKCMQLINCDKNAGFDQVNIMIVIYNNIMIIIACVW